MIKHISRLPLIGTALLSIGIAPAIANPETSEATLLAQAEICREVSSNISGLNVREAPSSTADVVGIVPGDRPVTLENLGTGGWVPISFPYDGYVAARYLTYCDEVAETPVATTPAVTPPSTVCRQVITRSGLNVRAEPNVYSERIGALTTGTNVQVSGAAAEYWVPITEPMDGYVASQFLGDC